MPHHRFSLPVLFLFALTSCSAADEAAEADDAGVHLPVASGVDLDISPEVSDLPDGWPSPQSACAFLDTHGLSTGGYRDHFGEWWCVGTRITSAGAEIGSGPPDEVTYTASGTRQHLSEILVVAQHFDGNDESVMRERAWMAARDVSTHVFGDNVPGEALTAFRAGSGNGTWTVNGIRVEVERDDYPTGRGYSMNYRLQRASAR